MEWSGVRATASSVDRLSPTTYVQIRQESHANVAFSPWRAGPLGVISTSKRAQCRTHRHNSKRRTRQGKIKPLLRLVLYSLNTVWSRNTKERHRNKEIPKALKLRRRQFCGCGKRRGTIRRRKPQRKSCVQILRQKLTTNDINSKYSNNNETIACIRPKIIAYFLNLGCNHNR